MSLYMCQMANRKEDVAASEREALCDNTDFYPEVWKCCIYQNIPEEFTPSRLTKRARGAKLTRDEELEITRPLMEKMQLKGRPIDLCHTKSVVGRIDDYWIDSANNGLVTFRIMKNARNASVARDLLLSGALDVSATTTEYHTPHTVLKVTGQRVALCPEGARKGAKILSKENVETYNEMRTQAFSNKLREATAKASKKSESESASVALANPDVLTEKDIMDCLIPVWCGSACTCDKMITINQNKTMASTTETINDKGSPGISGGAGPSVPANQPNSTSAHAPPASSGQDSRNGGGTGAGAGGDVRGIVDAPKPMEAPIVKPPAVPVTGTNAISEEIARTIAESEAVRRKAQEAMEAEAQRRAAAERKLASYASENARFQAEMARMRNQLAQAEAEAKANSNRVESKHSTHIPVPAAPPSHGSALPAHDNSVPPPPQPIPAMATPIATPAPAPIASAVPPRYQTPGNANQSGFDSLGSTGLTMLIQNLLEQNSQIQRQQQLEIQQLRNEHARSSGVYASKTAGSDDAERRAREEEDKRKYRLIQEKEDHDGRMALIKGFWQKAAGTELSQEQRKKIEAQMTTASRSDAEALILAAGNGEWARLGMPSPKKKKTVNASNDGDIVDDTTDNNVPVGGKRGLHKAFDHETEEGLRKSTTRASKRAKGNDGAPKEREIRFAMEWDEDRDVPRIDINVRKTTRSGMRRIELPARHQTDDLKSVDVNIGLIDALYSATRASVNDPGIMARYVPGSSGAELLPMFTENSGIFRADALARSGARRR